MAKSVLPRVHTLVICDDIEERWEGDSLHDLLGVRTQMTVPMFPYRCPQLCVYAQATGHARTWVRRVVVVRATNDDVVATTNYEESEFTGPTDFKELRFWIADCRFPEAGVYYIQLHFDDKLCAERAFEVFASEGE